MMSEPKITVRFDLDCVVMVNEIRVARIEGEGFRFLSAWEADSGFEVPTIWPSYLKALAAELPAIIATLERASDELLDIQTRLNEARRRAQAEIDAENTTYVYKPPRS